MDCIEEQLQKRRTKDEDTQADYPGRPAGSLAAYLHDNFDFVTAIEMAFPKDGQTGTAPSAQH